MTSMFAVDTSSLIAYIEGESGADVDLCAKLIPISELYLPAPVVVEALSNAKTRHLVEPTFRKLSILDFKDDFWFRASQLRANIIAQKLKANLADTLIAQSCIDHGVALITRDTDFRHFAKHGGLKLAV